MKAVLLAAGLGTRLAPLTDVIPKCLAPIKGVPLLYYWLKELEQAGVKEVLVNLHHHKDFVANFVEQLDLNLELKTVYEPKLLGTGGTILQNADFLGNDPFLLVHADNLSGLAVDRFIDEHLNRPPGTALTMMVFETTEPKTCGIVRLDRAGIVQEFHEKVENPPGNLANGAVYACEPEVLKYIQSLGKSQVDFSTEVLPAFVGKIATYSVDAYHQDIGSLPRLVAAQKDFSEKSQRQVPRDWFKASGKTVPLFLKEFSEALSRGLKKQVLVFDRFGEHEEKRLNSLSPATRKESLVMFHSVPPAFSETDFAKRYDMPWVVVSRA